MENDKTSASETASNGVSRRGFLGSVMAGLTVTALPGAILGARPEAQAEGANSAHSDSCADACPPHRAETRIGNFNAFMPGGIAFIKDDATGIVLNIGWDKTGRPGCSAPDCSYNLAHFELDGADVTFEWGRIGPEAAVVRIRADRNVKLAMDLPAEPWRFVHHYFSGVEQGLDGFAVTPDGRYLPWSLRVDPAPNGFTPKLSTHATVEVQVWPERPVHLVAGFGDLPELNSVGSTLDAAAAHYKATRAQASGDWGDFAGAITDNLNNSRLYSSLDKRVVNVIGRGGWLVSDPDILPYFTWDTSFNGLLASVEDPETAKESLRTVLRYQLPNGMVPQISHGIGCSNPPVTSMCAWKVYQRWGDKTLLDELYPRLLRWHDWWPKHSDGNQNGLLEWGSVTGGWKQALLATGWDDTPAFDGGKYAGTQMTVDAVDLNSLWSLDAEVLAKMARVLGRDSEAKRLDNEHQEMNRLINEQLWNEETGMYCNRLWDEDGKPGRHLVRFTPLNFYPLICGAPNQQRAQRVLAMLTDSRKFWGPWLLPTLPYDDPEYPKQEYWKGHVWGPANYIVWQGIRRYCDDRYQAEFARRSVNLFMRNWVARGTCNENYKSTDGTGDDYPHYTWGALLCQIGIELLYDIGVDGSPVPLHNSALMEEIELRNMPAEGKLYRVSAANGKVTIRPEQSGKDSRAGFVR